MPEEPIPNWSMENPMSVWRYLRDVCTWPMRERMCYFTLYSHRSADGEIEPGLRGLADEMGTSKNPASEAVARLQEAGALLVAARDGRNGTNRYELVPPWEVDGEIERKRRGIHAVTSPSESVGLNQDVGLKQTQGPNKGVGLKQGHQTQANPQKEGVECVSGSKTGTPENSAGSYLDPKLLEKDIETMRQNTLSNAEQKIEEEPVAPPVVETGKKKPSRRKAPADKTPKEPNPFNQAAQPLVRKVDEWLKGQGKPGIAGSAWAAAVTITGYALEGRKTGIPMPADEATTALDWAINGSDGYWRRRLMAAGVMAIRDIWAAWTQRGAPRPIANTYQDHTKTQGAQPSRWRGAGSQ